MFTKFKNLKPKIRTSQFIWPLLWLVIFALALVWRLPHLDAYSPFNDEGVYLMWGRLAADGYKLYSQTYAVQPPLFLEGLALAFRLAGSTLQTGHWAILPSFGLLALALSWLAYRSGRWPAAITALGLLSLSPLVFAYSRLAMAEIPATSLAVLSVLFCLIYLDTERRLWLFASGLALGLSLLNKALYPFIIGPVGLLLVVRGPVAGVKRGGTVWGRLAFDGLWWSLGVVIPMAVVLLFYDPAAIFYQAILFRGELRAAIPGSLAETWAQFFIFINSHWGFWLLAFGGIMATVWRGWQVNRGAGKKWGREEFSFLISSFLYPLTWFVWLLAGAAMLGWHTPLFSHHFVVLLPPLILLGAELITRWLGFLGVWHQPRPGQVLVHSPGWPAIVWSAFVIVAAFNLPALIKANQETAAIVTGGRETEALKLLRAVSLPDDFVMGDSQLLIFMADRRTPPPLGDVALVAIKAGRQTSERMQRLTMEYRSPAVVQWSLRLPWLPEYLDWVKANYLARRVWDNDHIIYFGQRVPPDQLLPHEQSVPLGEAVRLRGYQLPAGPVKFGQDLNLKVYWQTESPLARDYTIFTQLLDHNGVMVAGWDSQPLGGYFPTSQWPAGEIVTDVVRLPLPADLPAGDYTLVTGMYLLDTLERLHLPDGRDHLVLTTLTKVSE